MEISSCVAWGNAEKIAGEYLLREDLSFVLIMEKMLLEVLLLGLPAVAFASPLRALHGGDDWILPNSCTELFEAMYVKFVSQMKKQVMYLEEEEWLHSGKFEGDMILNTDQMLNLQPKNGIIGSTYRWPNNTVVYEISPDFDAAQKAAILAAFRNYESRTCIRFREKGASDTDYVSVTGSESGCWSFVGRNGGRQQLNLAFNTPGSGCFRNGTIIHEFLHALGFYHQQSAAERDDYVTIVWANIEPGQEHNFQKYNSSQVTNFGVPYDYGSIMHYPAVSFSINGEPTIIPKDPNAKIGQNLDFSNADIQKLKLMYGCV